MTLFSTSRLSVRCTAGVLVLMLLGATAQAGGFDCSRFKKNDDGTWSAVQATEIGGPTGRIDFTPGEVYKSGEQRKGLDIVKLLDANCNNK